MASANLGVSRVPNRWRGHVCKFSFHPKTNLPFIIPSPPEQTTEKCTFLEKNAYFLQKNALSCRKSVGEKLSGRTRLNHSWGRFGVFSNFSFQFSFEIQNIFRGNFVLQRCHPSNLLVCNFYAQVRKRQKNREVKGECIVKCHLRHLKLGLS